MKSTIRRAALVLLLGAGATESAQAGLLTYQGVTFSSTWNANILTLEIDAAHPTGDWSAAQGLEALAIKGIGNYTGVSVTAAPKGTSGWTTSASELTASGCSGKTSGQGGSRLCFFGSEIALADDMVFSFAFSGKGIVANDPHVKVEFADAKGNKVGSLLSQTLPPSPSPAPAPAPSPAPAPTPTPVAPSELVAHVLSLPMAMPASLEQPADRTGTAQAASSVPEPWSIALLLGGLAAMGRARRRARTGR